MVEFERRLSTKQKTGGVFGTLLNVYDGAFLRKYLNDF